MSDSYKLELRHRASAEEPIEDKHRKLMHAMTRYDPPYGYKGREIPSVPNIGKIVSVVPLRPLSKRGAKSYVCYSLRSKTYLKDKAEHDDHLIMEFKPQELDINMLLNQVFPAYIEAFDCYRAAIANREITASDWDRVVELSGSTGKDINGRDGVYRFHPANYFDRELCRRAFGLTPEQIVKRLEGKVETASLLNDGVLIIYSSKLPRSREEYEKIDSDIKALLK